MKRIIEIFICTLLIGTMILSTFSISVLSGNDTYIKNNINIKKTKFFGLHNLRSCLVDRANNNRNEYLNLNKVEKADGYFFNSRSDWSPWERVSTESTASSTWSSIVTDSAGNVYVVWQDDTNYSGCGSNYHIFYKMKPNGGSWTTTEVVSSKSSNDAEFASIAVEPDGTVHVAWDEYTNTTNDVYYRMKPAGGNWTTTERISLASCDYSAIPSICVDQDGNVHVAMTGMNNNNSMMYIYYKMKPAGGNWTPEELVTYDSMGSPYGPTLAVDSEGTVHIAWEEIVLPSYIVNIFYKTKQSGGNWTHAEQVSNSNILGMYQSLVIDTDDNVHVTWSDLTTNYWCDIDYRTKSKNGSWSNIETLSIYGYAMKSQISAGPNGSVSVVFDDLGSQYDIYYRTKPMGGNWSNAEVVTDDFNQDAVFPSLAINSSGYAHVTWESANSDNICYKHNNQVNSPPATPTAPNGPDHGGIATTYTFSAMTTDPDGDHISYLFDWGDGAHSSWVGPYASGATATATHAWSRAGTYLVKVKAKDVYGAETGWSPTHAITILTPILTIEAFKGGRGINAVLKNVGNGTATNITWSIDIVGKHIFYGAHSVGQIASLAPGNSTKIYNTALLLGLGKIYINATATCAEGATCSHEGKGFLLLIFVIGVK
jgi:hypothetical protein